MPRARPSRPARCPPPATAGWTRRSPSWRTWPGCRSPGIRRSSSAFTSGSRTPWATPARVNGRYRTTAQASWAAERRPGQRMGTRRRLDAELVRRGLARSREQAASLVADGRVLVAGQAAGKPATQVTAGDPILITGAGREPQYASRGGAKLAGALAAFPGLRVTGRRCLDAGASTGGFTDVLLRAGAAHVIAADVGYGQLAWALRTDERVTVLDRVNVRELQPGQVAPAPDLVTADLSFIPLELVLPALVACASPEADFVLLVKPQFEVGRDRVGAGGVVRDPRLRRDAVAGVAEAAQAHGLGVAGVVASPLPGPSGNVEYFLWLRRGAPPLRDDALRHAIEEGPR